MLSAQLLTEAILGLDFLMNYEVEISFSERRITLIVNEEVLNFEFTGAKETSANRFCDLGLCPSIPKLNTRQQLLIRVIATQRISPWEV